MAWVKSGTVAVTNGSPVVTGTGTGWFGSLQNGWAFVGPDGRVYEILTVDNATTITLATNYQGSTASGQVYAAMPTSSLAADLTAALQSLIANYQGIYDTVGQGRFQDGTLAAPGMAYDADRDTGFFRPGANILALVAGAVEQLRLTGGVASGAAVQSSATDATVGKLLRLDAGGQGFFGLGGSALPVISDCDTGVSATGFYRTNSSTANTPPSSNKWGMVLTTVAGTIAHQLWFSDGTNNLYDAERVWARTGTIGGAWSAWVQLVTSVGDQAISGTLSLGSAIIGQGNPSDIPLALYSNDPNCYLALNDSTTSGNNAVAILATGDDLKLRAGAGNRVEVKSDGNVGIGTSSPTVKLEVRGQIHAGGIPVGSTAKIASRNDDAAAGGYTATEAHASYTGSSISSNVQRAANSAYTFFQAYSGNWGDLEFKLRGDGNGTCDGSWTGGGADYAEFFEWLDGNPEGETRTGISVVLEGDKIRPAQEGETPIGVISANPSVVGDGDIDRWKGKYLRDDFGAYIWEDYEAVSWTETVTETETVQEQATEAQEVTREVIEVVNGKAIKRVVTETVQVPLFDEFPLVDEWGNDLGTHREPRMIDVQKVTTKEVQHSYAADEVPEGITVPEDAERVIQKRRKLSPEYDPAYAYIPRADRPEWDMVGLMGKLRLRKGQPVGDRWIKMRDVSPEVEEWLVR